MMLLADRLVTCSWLSRSGRRCLEREASLRLRRGDATALDGYDQHGRIRGARRAGDGPGREGVRACYWRAGRAADGVGLGPVRELSARIREDLIHLGLSIPARPFGSPRAQRRQRVT